MKFNESVIDEDDNYGFIVTYKDGSVKGFTEEEVNDDELMKYFLLGNMCLVEILLKIKVV